MVRHYSSAMSIGCVLVLIAAIAACARAEGSLVKAPDDSPICDWYSEECQQFKLTCTYGITKSVAAEGCERCVCAAPSDCKQQYEACQQLQCKYGVDRTLADDGCKQCSCTEDPCVSTKCSANKTCVTGHSKNPVTHEVKYSAHCIPVIIDAEDSTEVAPECRKAAEDCKVILCEYKVQRSRTGGCERCTCVTKDVDCGQLAHDCDTLNCTYGLNMTKGSDGCNRCSCLENPCLNKQCPVDKKCVVIPPNVPQTEYSANCRAEPRYETAYACEGKTLKIGCAEGSVIHLIRGNYGRFSMTICNDHGNTDWSVNCMSTRSLRVLHSRCSMHQNCSILASTNMFGDPCPNTLKYLEAHYQCVPASTTSTTTRPSPPWLITSQPTVWRSTAAPLPKNPVQPQQNETKKPTVITPPTFRPHITLPPEVKLGDVGTKKTTTRLPDSSSEPPSSSRDVLPDLKEDIPRVFEPDLPKKKKPVKEEDNVAVTEESMQWPVKDEDSDLVVQVHHPPKERPADTVIVDDYDRSYTATCLEPVDTGSADCGASAERRWYYSVHRGECIVFTFQGCEGTKNNFKSYGECADVCAVTASEPDDSSKCDRYSEECQQLEQTCAHGMTVSVAAEGCERCACAAPPDCRQHHEACQRLECKYSVDRTLGDDGCEQCSCTEDPCSNTNCSSKEKCVAAAYMNPDTNEIQYSANCAPDEDTNEVTSECEEAAAGCKALRCAYGVQRTRVPGDCERCACVTEDVDCGQLAQDCERLKCTYGMARTRGSDGCDRCSCLEHPCSNQQCPEGERCVATPYRDPVTQETKYSADCRTDVPQAPQLSTETEPEVTASEGGKATLRCIFHGKPPPKITWKLGEITIDGNVGRYRLLSDGALEIVSLYRNDSGVYICVGDNGLGVARQEIRLLVSVPVQTALMPSATNLVVGRELSLPCEVDGYPEPQVTWTKDNVRLLPNDRMWITNTRLTIHRVSRNDSGVYACHAANSYSQHESRVEITVTEPYVPAKCIDNPYVASCALIVQGKFCTHKYYSRFCCKSCVEAGQLDPSDIEPYVPAKCIDNPYVASCALIVQGKFCTHKYYSRFCCKSCVEAGQLDPSDIEPYVPAKCIDNPYVASCALIVQGKFCTHKYYSRFCCKSCVEAGQLDPSDIEMQGDAPFRKK